MTHITRNFKKFLKKRVCTSSKRLEKGEDKTKENKESKAEDSNEEIIMYKVQCYKCKGFGSQKNKCPTKEKDEDPKGKKVSQAFLKSNNDERDDDFLNEYYFMAIKEEEDDDDL